MMTDYTNKKVNFLHSKISVKINKQIYFNGQSKIYLCSDLNNPSTTYCLKIATARNDDKPSCNSINYEIFNLLSMKERPNIVQIIDYYSQEYQNLTTYFILMEYCGSGTLADKIARLSEDKTTFSETQIWRIIYQICHGLASIHRNKTVHRDIKPENILITLDGVHKICDFGSSTTKFYEVINYNNRNEIIFDVSRNTIPSFRAPEQLDLYTGYPINEKVDVWALGLILYALLFDSKLFNSRSYEDSYKVMNTTNTQRIVKGNIVLTEEMVQLYSPSIIELLKSMLKPNPNDRISAAEIVTFIEKNKEKLMKVGDMTQNNIIKKRAFSITKMISEATAKIFKRHSTQFWIIKLMNGDLSSVPKFKYMKLLVHKGWTKTNKITKVFTKISTWPIHYFSFMALKSLYVVHHYIFLGPPQTISPDNFNLDDFLNFFSNVWQTRYSSENYDKAEVLRNAYVTKFIISYSEYLKTKIAYHKKYPFIDNNFSIENLSSNKDFDFTQLVDKKFIFDTIAIFSLLYTKFIQIPIMVTQISNTIDAIIQVFNEELISIFSLIFHLIVAFKNYNSQNSSQISPSNKNDNISHLKVYDSQYLEITNKAKEYVEKYKKFRNDIKSTRVLLNFPVVNYNNSNSNILVEYLNSLDNELKFFPKSEFNLNAFFSNPKEIVGVRINRNTGKLIQSNMFFDEVKKGTRSNTMLEMSNTPMISNQKRKTVNTSSKSKIIPFDNPLVNHDKSFSPPRKIVTDLQRVTLHDNCDFSPEKFQHIKNNFDFDLAYKKEKQLKEGVANKQTSTTLNKEVGRLSEVRESSGRDSQINVESKNQSEHMSRNSERGRSMDRLDKRGRDIQNTNANISNMNENRVHIRNASNANIHNIDRDNIRASDPSKNFNQSLFNKNFFSKSNNNINDSYATFTSGSNGQIDKQEVKNNNYYTEPNENLNSIRKISEEKSEIDSSNMINILNELFESNKGIYGSNVNAGNNKPSNSNMIQNYNQFAQGGAIAPNRTPQGGLQKIPYFNNNSNNAANNRMMIGGPGNNPKNNPYMINQDNNSLVRIPQNSSNMYMNPLQNPGYKIPNYNNNFYNPYMMNNNNNLYNPSINVQNVNANPNMNNNMEYYETNISNKNINHINSNMGSTFNIPPRGVVGNNYYNPYNKGFMQNNFNNNVNQINNADKQYPNQIPNNFNQKEKKYNKDAPELSDPNIAGINNQNKQMINQNLQKQNLNNINQNTNKDIPLSNDMQNNSIDEDFNYESVISDLNSVNIINIQNNYNNIKLVNDETNIEDLANEFLKEELKRSNLQWLISSKDIKYDKQIGFGGSSEVFKADYRGTEVAVKKLRILEVKAENLKEFKREVSSLILLRHPYLVLFMGAIAEKDNICIVTEYCAGGTLFNLLHQQRELIITWELRLRILHEIAVGMNFLHTNTPPIIHRDLKSLNILLTEKIERPTDNTKVKISDFGLSKIMKTFDSSKEQMTGQLGTCHWMAPEVIENKHYSLKADVYSYGIIIWEVCTRKTPYQDMRQEQISFFVTVNKGRPDKSLLAPNTPSSFIKLMEMCWDAEPNNRPSFEQILDYLKKIKL